MLTKQAVQVEPSRRSPGDPDGVPAWALPELVLNDLFRVAAVGAGAGDIPPMGSTNGGGRIPNHGATRRRPLRAGDSQGLQGACGPRPINPEGRVGIRPAAGSNRGSRPGPPTRAQPVAGVADAGQGQPPGTSGMAGPRRSFPAEERSLDPQVAHRPLQGQGERVPGRAPRDPLSIFGADPTSPHRSGQGQQRREGEYRRRVSPTVLSPQKEPQLDSAEAPPSPDSLAGPGAQFSQVPARGVPAKAP